MAKKKVAVVLDAVKEQEKTLWQKVKDWFYHSETVALAWLMSLSGIVTTFVGSLDLAPFWTLFQTGTAFTNRQLIWMGVGVLGAGVATYIARVRNTRVINGQLI